LAGNTIAQAHSRLARLPRYQISRQVPEINRKIVGH
jgi:hypothetical protein